MDEENKQTDKTTPTRTAPSTINMESALPNVSKANINDADVIRMLPSQDEKAGEVVPADQPAQYQTSVPRNPTVSPTNQHDSQTTTMAQPTHDPVGIPVIRSVAAQTVLDQFFNTMPPIKQGSGTVTKPATLIAELVDDVPVPEVQHAQDKSNYGERDYADHAYNNSRFGVACNPPIIPADDSIAKLTVEEQNDTPVFVARLQNEQLKDRRKRIHQINTMRRLNTTGDMTPELYADKIVGMRTNEDGTPRLTHLVHPSIYFESLSDGERAAQVNICRELSRNNMQELAKAPRDELRVKPNLQGSLFEGQVHSPFIKIYHSFDNAATYEARFYGAYKSEYTLEDERRAAIGDVTGQDLDGRVIDDDVADSGDERSIHLPEEASVRRGYDERGTIADEDAMYDPFPSVNIKEHILHIKNAARAAGVKDYSIDLRQFARSKKAKLMFGAVETMTARHDRVSVVDEDIQEIVLDPTIQTSETIYAVDLLHFGVLAPSKCLDPLPQNAARYDRKQSLAMVSDSFMKTVRHINAAEIGKAKTIKAVKPTSDKIADIVFRQLVKNDQTAIQLLMKNYNGRPNKQQMHDVLKRAYYLPTLQRVTKKAMSKLIATSLRGSSDEVKYDVPEYSRVKELASEFGEVSVEALELAVTAGLKITSFREIRHYDSDDDDSFDSQGSNDGMMNELDHLAEAHDKADLFKTAADDDELAGLVISDVVKEHLAMSSEAVAQAKKRLILSKRVIKKKNGMCFYPFKFDHIHCYKMISMFWEFMYGSRLPFGRTVPNRAYLYIIGIFIDVNNVMGLRFSDEDYVFHLGGLSLVEKTLLNPSRPNQRLEDVYNASLRDCPDDSEMSGVMGALVTRLCRMNRLAARISSLNDLISDAKKQIAFTNSKIENARNRLSRDDSVSYGKATSAINLAGMMLGRQTVDSYKDALFEALGLGKPVKVPDAATIKYPYTLNCMNFARNINQLYKNRQTETSQLQAEYQLVCMIEAAMQTRTGRMEYMINTFKLTGNDKILKLWFGDLKHANEVKNWVLDVTRRVANSELVGTSTKYTEARKSLSPKSFIYESGSICYIPDAKGSTSFLEKREPTDFEFDFTRDEFIPEKRLVSEKVTVDTQLLLNMRGAAERHDLKIARDSTETRDVSSKPTTSIERTSKTCLT